MNFLVIGGCGFIGSHVVDALIAAGHRARVFDRRPERFRSALASVDYHIGDFADRMAVAEALVGIDCVFHLVSTTVPGTANLDPASDIQDNLVGTIRLLELMREMGTKSLIFLSSGGTVYGAPETIPVPEAHPLRPINSYGIVKVANEHYLRMYQSLYGIRTVAVRASNPYGPRQAHAGVQGFISTLLSRARRGEPIDVWGDGGVVRDYLYVSDLARLCVVVGTSDFTGAINGGSGVGHSLNEVISAARAVTGIDFDVSYKQARAIDVPISVLDVSCAQEKLGWKTEIPLTEGLSRTWEWFLQADQTGV